MCSLGSTELETVYVSENSLTCQVNENDVSTCTAQNCKISVHSILKPQAFIETSSQQLTRSQMASFPAVVSLPCGNVCSLTLPL